MYLIPYIERVSLMELIYSLNLKSTIPIIQM